MKKQLKKVTTLLAFITMALLFTACEDTSVSPTPVSSGGGGGTPPVNENLINKDINSKTVLKNHLTGVDYEICGSIRVNADLIIEPGVEILMCAGANISVEKDGSLFAVGSAALPIILRGKTASPGYWNALHINSNNPANVLDFVMISDGGGSTYYNSACVFVNNNNTGQLTLKNSTIMNSKGRGVDVENGASIPNFTNNTFTDNGDAPIRVAISIIGSLDAASDYSDGNVNNYIDIYHSDMNQAQVVEKVNVPYLIEGSSRIKSDLKLKPGVELLMAAGANLEIDATGSINAIGTSSNPIVIKGKVNSVGYWNAIHINSNNPLNKFSYVNIKNGGASSYFNYSSIWVNNNNNGSFNMNDCTISDSYAWGLYVESGASMIPSTVVAIESANTFSNNGTGTNANCTGNCNVYIK